MVRIGLVVLATLIAAAWSLGASVHAQQKAPAEVKSPGVKSKAGFMKIENIDGDSVDPPKPPPPPKKK